MMSAQTISLSAAGLEVTASSQPNPVIPAWFAEALLIGQYWQQHGLLDRLQQQVQVNRGRMGHYEVCDFVLLLLAYAASGLKTLSAFFAAMAPVRAVLMAVWGRQRCPVASTLSRFLADVNAEAVESLRQLFEADLFDHPLPRANEMGVRDRNGKRWLMFDVDGTAKTVRQRVLLSQASHPQPRRRSERACAKGYSGRKRGEVVRTRTTIEQAHSREWLGSFAAAGNGTSKEDLKRACQVIEQYLTRQQLSVSDGIVRLDGLYGSANYLTTLQQSKLAYVVRCRDYQLLKEPPVQAQLAQVPTQQYHHPDSPQVQRDLFDIACVDATRRGYLASMRLVIVRMIRFAKLKPKVGKGEGKYLYEVFLTSLPPSGFTAADVLSLYNGRGGFEQTLSEEDQECDCDRWCSWHPEGQSFWQILSQWVWNWRTRIGWQQQVNQEVRQTLWSSKLESLPSPQASSPSPSLAEQNDASTGQSHAVQYAPMQVAPGWAKSRHKYGGEDFKVIDDETLQCPAGEIMHRQEIRYNRQGDMQMLFGLKPSICQACSVKMHCLAEESKATRGRRVSVTRRRLPPPLAIAEQPEIVVLERHSEVITIGIEPIIWFDIPATQLRRELQNHLRQHQAIIRYLESDKILNSMEPSKLSTKRLLTRNQRAHRRLSWSERTKRNAIVQKSAMWQVQLFGVSLKLIDTLQPRQEQVSG